MVNRPYHDYSTSALRELAVDLAASQAQIEDQRADYLKRAGSDDDDIRQLDVLIEDLDDRLAAVDRELVTRDRVRAAANSSGDHPKPHCHAKSAPKVVSGRGRR